MKGSPVNPESVQSEMSLADYLAVQAMVGLIASYPNGRAEPTEIAPIAYEFAYYMLLQKEGSDAGCDD
jgi:hypothetical protein